MDLKQALAIVARQVVHNALDSIEWEDYPEIGLGDWSEVMRMARMQAPGDKSFVAAHAWLADRASGQSKE